MQSIVPMQCLQREYEADKETFLSVFDAVCSASAFCDGDFVRAFEREFAAHLALRGCSGVNSGTSALFLTMKALGVGRGDEVVVPSATFFATASAVLMTGATPVFADCDARTWQISPESVASLLTEKTKLIVGVHLYGGAFDTNAIGKLAGEAGIPYIEDACQAAGTKIGGKRAGTFGAAGCFSFYPTKNIGAFGEGGAVVSDDEALIRRIGFLKKHAQTPDGDHLELGFNMRMEGLQGAFLRVKLQSLDRAVERRRAIAAYYRQAAERSGALRYQQSLPGTEHSYHLFVVAPGSRADFTAYMRDRGIETAVHYPIPLHLQTAFYGGYYRGALPNAEALCRRCVSVPVSPLLTDAETERVYEALRDYRGASPEES
ncbi:MAG: DegT/DnrJ/EryC1/StrS family aminotransferase [Clostridia bacterium]|nr:DegT/DnrJ/EryC1/StrS family aminotransferase [Clostridia bacterium]